MSASPKLFRDPVHDIISFDRNDPIERVLLAVVNTASVQRLRRIRQLGMSFLVYHGAEHSRFAHSMGVCHLALRMHDQIFPDREGGDRLALGVAALLHDIGHGPFSHVIERVIGSTHETKTLQLIENKETEIYQTMSEADESLPHRVASILRGTHSCRALTDLVSSQLDADRLDYILRDGLGTGVKIGTYDLARIVGMLEVVDNRLVVRDRALEAVEGYLLARFHMYTQVYLHKASRSAERMLGAMITRARALIDEGQVPYGTDDNSPFARLVHGEELTMAEHCDLDDTDLWHVFKRWTQSEDDILREFAVGITSRRLYKTITVDPADPRGPTGAIDDARKATQEAGYDPVYHLLVDRGADTPYRPYQVGMTTEPIRILTAQGHVMPIEKCSAIVRLLGESYHEIIRICVPEALRERIEKVASPAGAPSLV